MYFSQSVDLWVANFSMLDFHLVRYRVRYHLWT